MLRRGAIVHGDNNGRGSAAELPAHSVISKGVRREESEAAAVEENDDGKNSVTRGGCGSVDTNPEFSVLVNSDVFSRNAVNGFGFAWALNIEDFQETAFNGAVGSTGEIR